MSGKRSLTRVRAYTRWRAMIARCTDPTHEKWDRYGGRGIQVCERWMTFDLYYADTGDRPADGLTIDRVNNDGDYEPTNWRWATASEQRRNAYDPRAAQTECIHGHPFDEENTYRTYRGRRACRVCARLATNESAKRRRRAKAAQ